MSECASEGMASAEEPPGGMSAMERECRAERRRTAKLVECSAMLRREASQRYARDAFKALFQNEVGATGGGFAAAGKGRVIGTG